jgi:DNA-binding transcriptional LysR family regulator
MLGQIFRPIVDDDIDVEVVRMNRLYVVASAQNPFARRRKISLAGLVDEPWILYPPDNVVGAFHAGAFRRSGLGLPPKHVISYSLDVRMHLLATGRYLTMLGSQVLQYNSERWALKRLPIDLQVPETPLAIFTLKNRTISPVAQLFVEGVRTLAKSAMNM